MNEKKEKHYNRWHKIYVLFSVFLFLCFQCANAQRRCTVLCRAQYSASIGGGNEPIPNVSITVLRVGATVQVPTIYITDDYGQVYIPFTVGEIYDITIVYKDVEKGVRLRYDGEVVLLISIDPYKPHIGDIVFLAPQPIEKPTFVMSIENLVWFAFGAILSLIGSVIYYRWRGRKRYV